MKTSFEQWLWLPVVLLCGMLLIVGILAGALSR